MYPSFFGGRVGVALLLIRLAAGLALFFHGLQKVSGGASTWMGTDSWAPGYLQLLAAWSECAGGLGLAVGLLTPLAALGIMATMGTAVLAVHVAGGDPFVRLHGAAEETALLGLPVSIVRVGGEGGSYELALLFFAVAFAVLLAGPGRFSLDALLFGRGRRRLD
jgi:putative oxidoreductase